MKARMRIRWRVRMTQTGHRVRPGNRNFETFTAMVPRGPGPRFSGGQGKSLGCRRRFLGSSRFGFKWQRRLQIAGGAAPSGTEILEATRYFAPPFGFDGQVSFGVSDDVARNAPSSALTQGGVAETTEDRRLAVYGATMLAGLCHRSVLRCGRLAERNSGVPHILAVRARRKKNCFAVSRIRHPRQPGALETQSTPSVVQQDPARNRCKPSGGMLG